MPGAYDDGTETFGTSTQQLSTERAAKEKSELSNATGTDAVPEMEVHWQPSLPFTQVFHFTGVCEVCGAPAARWCDTCGEVYYCSKKHQKRVSGT